jgi:hypothetical protein
MGTDLFSSIVSNSSAPLTNLAVVTPDDTNDLPFTTRAIFLQAAGNVSVIMAKDSVPITISGLAVGVWHPLRVKRVRVTGTTVSAGNLLAGW